MCYGQKKWKEIILLWMFAASLNLDGNLIFTEYLIMHLPE